MSTAQTAPVEVERPGSDEAIEPDVPWIVIVWNDPKLMMDVHVKGKAVVSNGSRDEAERDVARLHAYGLWATMQQDR